MVVEGEAEGEAEEKQKSSGGTPHFQQFHQAVNRDAINLPSEKGGAKAFRRRGGKRECKGCGNFHSLLSLIVVVVTVANPGCAAPSCDPASHAPLPAVAGGSRTDLLHTYCRGFARLPLKRHCTGGEPPSPLAALAWALSGPSPAPDAPTAPGSRSGTEPPRTQAVGDDAWHTWQCRCIVGTSYSPGAMLLGPQQAEHSGCRGRSESWRTRLHPACVCTRETGSVGDCCSSCCYCHCQAASKGHVWVQAVTELHRPTWRARQRASVGRRHRHHHVRRLSLHHTPGPCGSNSREPRGHTQPWPVMLPDRPRGRRHYQHCQHQQPRPHAWQDLRTRRQERKEWQGTAGGCWQLARALPTTSAHWHRVPGGKLAMVPLPGSGSPARHPPPVAGAAELRAQALLAAGAPRRRKAGRCLTTQPRTGRATLPASQNAMRCNRRKSAPYHRDALSSSAPPRLACRRLCSTALGTWQPQAKLPHLAPLPRRVAAKTTAHRTPSGGCKQCLPSSPSH